MNAYVIFTSHLISAIPCGASLLLSILTELVENKYLEFLSNTVTVFECQTGETLSSLIICAIAFVEYLLEEENQKKTPIIESISDDEIDEDESYTGPTPNLIQGSEPITWSLITSPTGMSIDSETGVIDWSDPDPSNSPYTITIRATNSEGSDDESWQLIVEINDPPEQTGCTLPAPNPSSVSNDYYFVTFNWGAVANAIQYHIRIGGSATNLTTQEIANCGGPVTACQERLADSTQFTEYMGTAPYGTYYWAVVAVCDDGSRGEWSTPRSFTYVEVAPPDPEF